MCFYPRRILALAGLFLLFLLRHAPLSSLGANPLLSFAAVEKAQAARCLGMAACATLIFLLARRGRGSTIFMPLLLTGCTALFFASHAFFAPGAEASFFTACEALTGTFAAASLHLFFSSVPRERLGLCLGLALAAGESANLAGLPFCLVPGLLTPDRLQTAVGATLLLLWLVLTAAWTAPPHTRPAKIAPEREKTPPRLPALCALFTTGGLFCILLGLACNQDFSLPMAPGSRVDSLRGVLLFTAPLAGAVWDRGRPGIRLLLALTVWTAFAALAVPLVQDENMRAALYGSLRVGMQIFFMTVLLLAAGLSGANLVPLLCSLVCSLSGMAPLAVYLENGLPDKAIELVGIGTFVSFVLLLLLLWRTLPVWLGRLEPAPARLAVEPAPLGWGETGEGDKMEAFALTFDLHWRERDMLERLLRREDSAEMALALNLSRNSIKTYIYRLLKKTGVSSRSDLRHFYLEWRPEPMAEEKNGPPRRLL